MTRPISHLSLTAGLAAASLTTSLALAQQPATTTLPTAGPEASGPEASGPEASGREGVLFALPKQLHAGEALLGKSRLYPSPVAHDIDGDGLADLVVGDLRGHLTYALRLPGDGIRFGNEQQLEDAEGKILDFGNW